MVGIVGKRREKETTKEKNGRQSEILERKR